MNNRGSYTVDDSFSILKSNTNKSEVIADSIRYKFKDRFILSISIENYFKNRKMNTFDIEANNTIAFDNQSKAGIILIRLTDPPWY